MQASYNIRIVNGRKLVFGKVGIYYYHAVPLTIVLADLKDQVII